MSIIITTINVQRYPLYRSFSEKASWASTITDHCVDGCRLSSKAANASWQAWASQVTVASAAAMASDFRVR